ncbi:IS3 family transposase [Ornithinimicrobium sp. Y1694]
MTTADVGTDDGGMSPRADQPKRRRFTAEFKAAILAEYDAADRGERGAILRREGLYSSHIIEWRKAAAAGAQAGLAGPPRDRRDKELQALRERAEKAEAELARTKAALDLGGKSTRALGDALRERGQAAAVAAVINPAVDDLAVHVGTSAACGLLGRSRAGHYRAKNPPPPAEPAPRPVPANKLTEAERAQVLGVLTSEEFADKAVAQAWATLLDEGIYLCSQSTMHRILRENDMAGERRRQATHPARTRPELVATGPGQVWSWDITKLRGPDRGVYYDLYVVLDIFSRFVVAWTIAAREDADIARNMLEQAMGVHGVPDAVHADRGTSMTSKPVAQLLVDLGVARSHSRPHVSNDNPYSEAAFKTLKYAPVFPERFGSLADAAAFAEAFFSYYNHEHRHSGIGLHTPASVHYGTAGQVRAHRQSTLDAAYAAHPERFGHRRPQPPKLPQAAWINQPSQEALIQTT